MAAVLPQPVANPYRKGSIFALVKSYVTPLHWWTLAKGPHVFLSGGLDVIRPRIGGVNLTAFDGPMIWQQDGKYKVPVFGPGSPGKLRAIIPNPGPLFSMLEIARADAGGYTWGLVYPGLHLDSGLRNSRGDAVFEIAEPGSPISGGAGLASGVRGCKAVVVDMVNKEVSQAVNGGTFTTANTTTNSGQLNLLVPQPDTTVTFEVGRAGPGDLHVGTCNDYLIIPGDLRSYDGLWADYAAHTLADWD